MTRARAIEPKIRKIVSDPTDVKQGSAMDQGAESEGLIIRYRLSDIVSRKSCGDIDTGEE